MGYNAFIYVPGYAADGDNESEVFDSAAEAWAWLACEREAVESMIVPASEYRTPYSHVVTMLRQFEIYGRTGYYHGATPGYVGSDDLGIAYEVRKGEG